MNTNDIFTQNTLQEIKTAQEAIILQEIQVGQTNKQNELIFFLKPELLKTVEVEKVLNSFELIETKFQSFNIEINGAAILPGSVLEKMEIMNRHYGYINLLSRKASEIIDADTRQKLFEHLKIQDTDDHMILGGHEFLHSFNTDLENLSEIWFKGDANKIRSGFYFREDNFQDQPILLINGFHPSQLMHFTREDHRILVMLLHTDTDWHALKFDLVGDTFPEKAKTNSIRGLLYQNPSHYGLETVGINTNGVHLSAGPFEAAFEVVNFFGTLLNMNPEKTPPLAIKRAIDANIPVKQALGLLENPAVNHSDLFSETENMNTDEAVKFANASKLSS